MIVNIDDFTTSGRTVRTGGNAEGISKVLVLGNEEVSALLDLFRYLHWEEGRLMRPEEYCKGWSDLYIHEDNMVVLREMKKVIFG